MPPPPPLLPTAPSARPCRLLPRPSPSPHWPPPLVCASCGQKRRARASAVIEHERRRILSSLSSSDPDAAPQADETRLGGAADGGGQGDPPGAANDGRAGMSSPVERCIHIQQPVHHHAPEGEGEPRAREPILVNGGWIRCGAQPSSEIEKAISFYTIRGATKVVRVRDCVLMRPSDTHNASYVARVESLESDGRGSVRVRRYYPPEESKGGRRQFHGAKCRFLSDHIDTQSAHTIEGKCIVHCFKNYTKLDNVGPKTSSTDASTRQPPGRSPRLCHRVL